MNKPSPKVSIIIPTYNCSSYLGQAIESVLSQTFIDYEIIVIDDGSTDETLPALNPYQSQIRYIFQPNLGVAAARNRGIAEAQGELISFLDADDRFWPHKLEKQVTCFQNTSKKLGISISGWQLITQTGEAICMVEPWASCQIINLETMVLKKPVRPSATIIRREWCERIEGFDENLSSAEDLDFLLRLMLAGCEAIGLPEVLVDYRQRPNSLMSQGNKLIADTEKVMQNFFSHSDLPQNISILKSKERYQSYCWLSARMYYNGYLDEAEICLQKTLSCTSKSRLKTALDWLESFRYFAIEYAQNFDPYQLVSSKLWKNSLSLLESYPETGSINVRSCLQSDVESLQHPKQQIDSQHRILLYSDDPGAGGVLQCNHAIICHLAKLGYTTSHLHFQESTPLSSKERSLSIEQIDLGYHADLDLTRTLKDIEGSKQHFLKEKPDLIIFSDGWPFSNLAAKQAAIDLKIPYIIVLGFIESSCATYNYQDGVDYRGIVSQQYTCAQSVIAVSQDNLSLLRQLFNLSNTLGQVIYNGCPKEFFDPPNPNIREKLRQKMEIPKDAVICFTSARMESVKGYQYQVEAIRQLKESPVWKNLYFVWAGTGNKHLEHSNESELRAAIEKLDVEDRVKFLGQRWDIPDLLDTIDIFVLPSQAEGMPLSVMEAMAKGIPVIASAVSGIPEELGETGQLLPDPNKQSEKTIDQLVKSITKLAHSKQLRQSIGQRGKQRAEELFKQSIMLSQYEKIIKQYLHSTTSKNQELRDKKLLSTHLNQQEVLDIQRDFYYSAHIWSAWHQYQQKNIDKMVVALKKALFLKKSSKHKASIKIEWIKWFAKFSHERKEEFNSYQLIQMKSWQSIWDDI